MTREEIEELKGLAASMGLYDDKNPCKRAVVLGKAIEALEQEPCTDAISRQAVLEIQEKYAEHIGATKFWQMRDDIKALQPVTPQYTDAEIQKMQDLEFAEIQKAYEIGKEEGSEEKPNKWIPVSERLPKGYQRILVTRRMFHWANEPVKYTVDIKCFDGNVDFVAWMPLPDPFEGNTK